MKIELNVAGFLYTIVALGTSFFSFEFNLIALVKGVAQINFFDIFLSKPDLFEGFFCAGGLNLSCHVLACLRIVKTIFFLKSELAHFIFNRSRLDKYPDCVSLSLLNLMASL